MKILSAAQIRDVDAYTIKHEPIASIDLMERAANACTEWIAVHFGKERPVRIFCGTGNNGGDGLAIARMLSDEGYKVEVFKVRHSASPSADFLHNEAKIGAIGAVKKNDITSDAGLPVLAPGDLVVDAIFGSGLNRPADGLAAEVIRHINRADCTVVAVDIPSGLFSEDNTGNSPDNIIRARFTLTFEVPRLVFMFQSCHRFVGEWRVLSIGLHREYMESLPCSNHLITRDVARSIVVQRDKFAHKGAYGHALLIAGGYGKMGAAVLAASGCLRSGAGLLTVYIPQCGYNIMQATAPEAMVVTGTGEKTIASLPSMDGYNAIGIGPGIGTSEETAAVVKLLIQNTAQPIVFDADAINLLGANRTWLPFMRPGSIFTPHPLEFERLAGNDADVLRTGDFERYRTQLDFAAKHNAWVVLKGAHTAVACPDGKCYFNSTGNPGMATGGSGDVLTGIILGLLSRGYSREESCVLGVYLHGLAGDIAARKTGEEALTARDIVNNLGEAFLAVGEGNWVSG